MGSSRRPPELPRGVSDGGTKSDYGGPGSARRRRGGRGGRHRARKEPTNTRKVEPVDPEGRRRKRGGRRQRERDRVRMEHRRDRAEPIPPAPRDFACHICGRNHWTVECPKLLRHPEDYPMIDRRRGCRKCGQRGHKAVECQKRKYKCKECGGLHDTKDCVYDHVPEDWHEFVDAATHHVFYTNADESEVQWVPPTHKLDVVLWYCPNCHVMNPSEHNSCVKCHATRPAVLAEEEQRKRAEVGEKTSGSLSSSSSSTSDSDAEEEDLDGDEESSVSESGSGDSADETEDEEKKSTKQGEEREGAARRGDVEGDGHPGASRSSRK